MKIGRFIEKVQTTKDTVRHYEEIDLLRPAWESTYRIYGEKEVNDFQAIKEMQAMGMSLKEIQVIFEVKRNNGCGSNELLGEFIQTMMQKQENLLKEEQEIKYKRKQMTEMVDVLTKLNQAED